MEQVTLRITCYGKAGRNRPGVFKFSPGLAVDLLQGAGWSALGGGREYVCLSAPAGVRWAKHPELTGQHPLVPVRVPDVDEILALARDLHAARTPYQGTFGCWHVEYTLRYLRRWGVVRFTLGPDPTGPVVGEQPVTIPTCFRIGDPMVWGLELLWEVDDAEPVRHEHFDNVIA